MNESIEDCEKYQKLISEHKQRVKYSLPTYLVSFPRSGSNFLQMILEKSSGFQCRSIYTRGIDLPENILSLKSHSVSYEYLLDEICRILPPVKRPSKLILLIRDPRDVIVSFFEYTQATKDMRINQDEFFNNYDFFLAAPIDKECKRKVEYAPISVGKAYKKHLNQWFLGGLSNNSKCLVVRYENLLIRPSKEFERIFYFLGLECSVAMQFLDVKVSLYSNEPRERCQAFSWKKNYKKYKKLVEETNLLLKEEIIELGY